ncbi:MAG TPA: hypothetical protein V6C97_01130, partial [Oculatellaceae cyanobacterium]
MVASLPALGLPVSTSTYAASVGVCVVVEAAGDVVSDFASFGAVAIGIASSAVCVVVVVVVVVVAAAAVVCVVCACFLLSFVRLCVSCMFIFAL